MHNINELEKRWLNYKIKSYLPHAGAILTSILLFVYIFNAVDFTNEKEKEKFVKKQIIAKEVIEKKEKPEINIVNNDSIKSDITNNDKTISLTPSLDFIKRLRINSINSYEPETIESKPPQSQNNNDIKDDTTVVQNKHNIEFEEKAITMTLVKQETVDDINHVIKRFKKSNNPALSLFIAKKYYKLKNYHKAYNYALITNGLNNNIDESWIIFSKSLVKLDKKKRAIDTLEKYIEQSSSINAQVLLNNIQSGAFK